MLVAAGRLTPLYGRRLQRVSFWLLCLIAVVGLMAAAGSAPHALAQGQGGGLHVVNPPSGGAIVYGTLENQKDQTLGMVYMLRQVHGHFGDKPELGKLVQARDGSSLAAFFTLTDKNFSHTQQGGMVIVATVNGQMMAAVLTDEFKHFAASQPGMVRAVMSAWHPGGGAARAGSGGPANSGGRAVVFGASQKLFPATGGDRSVTIDLPPLWKITGVSGGQVTATGPNGEMLGASLIWQNLGRAMTGDLWTSYVNAANIIRQRNGKPQGSYHLISRSQTPRGQYTVGPGMIAYFMVDFHDGVGPCKGVAQVSPAAGGALFVTTTWIPVKLYDAEEPLMVKIVNSQRQNTQVISVEGQRDMDRIRLQAEYNDQQTKDIDARREASAQSYESQRNAFNTRNNVGGGSQQASGNSHFDDMDAGSEDMQNYILDRGVVQSTSTGAYGTFSDSFADALVKNNPDKFQAVTNRQLQASGQW